MLNRFTYFSGQLKTDIVCLLIGLGLFYVAIGHAQTKPDIASLKQRTVLDDYYSNVVIGYNIVSNTQKYAGRYTGNKLNCSHCHRNAGTVAGQLPLNIAGVYPQWRAKNDQLTDLAFKIRECFVYSLNGIMPPANAPEIIAIKTYINYLSQNQIIGKSPPGRGVELVPQTGRDPNPVNGHVVYQLFCTECHGEEGAGLANTPPVWGMQSYPVGASMNEIRTAAGFIRTKMLTTKQVDLSLQQALDVAAFLKTRLRPVDPGKSKLPKVLQDFAAAMGLFTNE